MVGVLSILPLSGTFPRLGCVDGIDILAWRVDVSPASIFLHARAEQTRRTLQLLNNYWLEWEGFEKRFAETGASGAGNPPVQPGDAMNLLRVTLTDDAGNLFASPIARAAGSGTEWDVTWEWTRPSPLGATLRFESESPTGEIVQFEVPIPSFPEV